MAKWKYIDFSEAVNVNIGHDFSFLDSDQFPADVRLVRVEYKPKELTALRLVVESDSYEDRPEDEIFNSPGLNITMHTVSTQLSDINVQFASYSLIPPNRIRASEDEWLYVNLPARRT